MTSLMTSPGYSVTVQSVFRCEGWVLRYNVWVDSARMPEDRGGLSVRFTDECPVVLFARMVSRVVAAEALELLGLSRREAEDAIEAALDDPATV